MTYTRKDIWADLIFVSVIGLIAYGTVRLCRPGARRIWNAFTTFTSTAETPVTAGTAADYDWSVETLDGRRLELASFKNKVVFLNFWATWCGPCRMELPDIEKLYQKFKGTDAVFLLVSDEDPGTLKAFVAKNKIEAPVVRAAMIPRFFQTRGIPATFILTRDGKVALSQIGAHNWNEKHSVDLIRTLLNDKATASQKPQ